ncbi:hypothetical protein BD309DRAFT_954942 [Dichomitus squalens]|nr:hypothetical protein BD309DRAFT_954942 [Dichomitus squalens]
MFARVTVPEVKLFSSFLQFLDAQPVLGVHIRALRLIGDPLACYYYMAVSHLTLDGFLSIISQLSALRTLSLWDIQACDHPSTFRLADVAGQVKPALQKLSIRNPRGRHSWGTTLRWLLSNCSVDALEIADVPLADTLEGVLALTPLSDRVSVRSLAIIGSRWPNEYSYQFFEALICPGSLRTFSARCPTPLCATYILSFIRSIGQNIAKLCLDIAPLSVQGEEPDWKVIGEGIAACPNLEHLHIKVSACSLYDYSVHPRYTVFSTILPYASRTLRTLTIELAADPPWCYELGDLETWDLPTLDDYLTREPVEFPSLTGVVIELGLPTSFKNSGLAFILLPKLRGLKETGLLLVLCDDITQSFRTVYGIEPLQKADEGYAV